MLQCVEFFPAFARCGIEQCLCHVVVGDLLARAVEFQLPAEVLGEDAEVEYLGEWAADAKGRARGFFALTGEQEVGIVVGVFLREAW